MSTTITLKTATGKTKTACVGDPVRCELLVGRLRIARIDAAGVWLADAEDEAQTPYPAPYAADFVTAL